MDRVRKQIFCNDMEEYIVDFSVAVLDSGVGHHPDLENVVAFHDFVNDKNFLYDDCGHGTHVCGILAGSGKASKGLYKGIAPKTPIVVGKILDNNGNGSMRILKEALIWIMNIRDNYNIKIVNISVGINDTSNKKILHEVMSLLQKMWDVGIIVVCSVGNRGPKEGSLSFLAENPNIISVGCHDGEYYKDLPGRCESYSGRGPGLYAIKKPDVVAPGTEIMSCNAFYRKTNRGYKDLYIRKSGTSMATPIVSGTLALAVQKFPHLNNMEIKRKLIYSATDLHEPWIKQGWGMVHAERLLT